MSFSVQERVDQGGHVSRTSSKPYSAKDGKAWAEGWNDVVNRLPPRKQYDLGPLGATYESGRLCATEARHCGVDLPLWSGRLFTRWHPDVLAAYGMACRSPRYTNPIPGLSSVKK